MKSNDQPTPSSSADVPSLLRQKQVKYADLANVLADLRNTAKHAPGEALDEALASALLAKQPVKAAPAPIERMDADSPKGAVGSEGSAAGSVENPGRRWSDRFFQHVAEATEKPAIIPNPVAASTTATPGQGESIRSQLSALDASLTREQRYRQQFEEASAKAALADRLEKQLAASQAAVGSLKDRETSLLAELETLQARARQATAVAEGLAQRQVELNDAQTRITTLESRLKEAEHKGALASHLEQELSKTRADLEEARLREKRLQTSLSIAHEATDSAEETRAELAQLHQALADARNREETLHIQLAEVQGAISLARQVEEDLARSRADLAEARLKAEALEGELVERTHALEQARTTTIELEAVRSRLTEATDTILDLQARLAAAKRDAGDAPALRQELDALHERTQAAEARAKELSATAADGKHARVRAEAAETELVAIRGILASLEDECHALRNELAQSRQSVGRVRELENRIARHEDALAEVRSREAELTAALAEAESRLQDAANLSARLASETDRRLVLQKELTSITAELDSTRAALANATREANRIPALEAEIAQYQAQLEEASARESALHLEVQTIEQKLAAAERLSQSLTGDARRRQELDGEVGSLKAQLSDARIALQSARDAASAASALEAARLAEQIARAEALETELTALQSAYETVQSELTKTKASLKEALEIAATVEDLRSALNRQKAEAELARERIAELTSGLEEARKQLISEKADAQLQAAKLEKARDSANADLAEIRAREATLTDKLVHAEAAAARVPLLESRLQELESAAVHARAREVELQNEKQLRMAAEVATRLPAQGFSEYSSRSATWSPEPPDPLRSLLRRLAGALIWVGHHPRITLAGAAALIAFAVLTALFLFTPSYPAIVDATVIRMESPLAGTILTAGGEPGMNVAKDELLFSIKNAEDGRSKVRDARDAKVAAEEEVKYLKTVQSALARKQLALGVPDVTSAQDAAWLNESDVPKATAANRDSAPSSMWVPDAPDTDSADYIALRIEENRAKLNAAKEKFDAAESAFVAAEEHFKKTEKIEVRAPTLGVIQSMRVTPGTPVEVGTVLCELIDSSSVFIEAAFPEHLVRDESIIGRRVQVSLEDSRTTFEGEIVTAGYAPGAGGKQTAVSLNGIRKDYLLVSIRITNSAWLNDSGLASQVGRRAKAKLL